MACGSEAPQEDPRDVAVRDAALRAAAYLSSTTEPVGVDVVVAMLVYAEAADDSYVEARAARRLRVLPDSETRPFGIALGSEHPVITSRAFRETQDEPDPAFALMDDRDRLCPLAALECTESAECDEYAAASLWGYALTHQALSLVFAHWAECPRDSQGEDVARLGGRLVSEAHFDSSPSDLMSERMAMLGQLGYGAAIEDSWIDALVASQQPDGSFLLAPGGESHPHPTGMALWAFAGWLRGDL